MKIDLHVHTSERSHCGKATQEEQIRAAIDARLDAIVFTDHSRLAPAATLEEFNERYPNLWIIGGIEITVDQEDVIVLGIRDRDLETREWSYPSLRKFVTERDGFLAVVHPFRYHRELLLNVDRVVPDAIEVYSCSTPPDAEDRIRAMAADLGIPVLSNSDAHRAELIGQWYNILPHRPANEEELIDILKSGDFDCRVEEEEVDDD